MGRIGVDGVEGRGAGEPEPAQPAEVDLAEDAVHLEVVVAVLHTVGRQVAEERDQAVPAGAAHVHPHTLERGVPADLDAAAGDGARPEHVHSLGLGQ